MLSDLASSITATLAVFTTALAAASIQRTTRIIAIIFIPHWTAVLYVTPFISFLYIDMLGKLELPFISLSRPY